MQQAQGHSRRRKFLGVFATLTLALLAFGLVKATFKRGEALPRTPCHDALLRTDYILTQLISTNNPAITNMAPTDALAPYVLNGELPRCPEGGVIRIGLGNFATACGKHGAVKQAAPPNRSPNLFESVFSLIGAVKVRSQSSRNPCIANLKLIDGNIQQWGLENRKEGGDLINLSAASQYFQNRTFPKCPAGGKYWVTVVSNQPCCTIMGHSLP